MRSSAVNELPSEKFEISRQGERLGVPPLIDGLEYIGCICCFGLFAHIDN